MTEHEIQGFAVKALRKIGFRVCVTSNRKKTSNTPGTPDVFVHIKRGTWIALEFKQPKGRASAEQQVLSDSGCSYIVSSVDVAINICLQFKDKNK